MGCLIEWNKEGIVERLIVLDTETTGIEPAEGHRIVEIGCTALVNLGKSGTRQWYLNPERDIPVEATRVHGITIEKVAHAPLFKDIVDEFLTFIGEDRLVIHNAAFDLGFLNAELARIGRPGLDPARAIDTLTLARRRFPNASASLDALCRRFRIDLSQRTTHGALLDTDLLADVYVELMGGGQFSLALGVDSEVKTASQALVREQEPVEAMQFGPRSWPLSPGEEVEHRNYLEFLKKKANVVRWAEVP
ncbi:MAG: DNA polymerase III subunit epsilon [Magnetococcales bacterium]|nr:DNA polymerase III subunit epsilon [Magnetococcales bacterium]MBF0346560.1 DNA polymerase III subunit epsilon [Magnetococcales bacterium]MBF0632012.1 DNA polymerase III subunit epsilon [Magnetococcales bacterium]